MSKEWQYGLLAKLPTLNPAWPQELQAQWLRAFDRLLAMGEAHVPIASIELVEERARRMWAEGFITDLIEEMVGCGRPLEVWGWDEETEQGHWREKALDSLREQGMR